MLELNSPYRKNKVNLEDYDYLADIQNRLMLADLEAHELDLLEELLYGPPKRCIIKLTQEFDLNEKDIEKSLKKFQEAGLFQIKENNIILNKEKRKYFETQITKFDSSFVPGMEYLQSLLRKAPFHILLNWYPIPRTSNNIFDSIIEKYLLTPQIFQRYLMELNFGNEAVSSIVDDVFNSKEFQVFGKDLKKKYNLSDEKFEEIMLHLEFNFVCCLTYKKVGHSWQQVVTPFYEWQQYLKFLQNSKPIPIETPEKVKKYRHNEFAFIEDITAILNLCKYEPLPLVLDNQEKWLPDKVFHKKIKEVLSEGDFKTEEDFLLYLSRLIQKLLFLKLVKISDSSLIIHEDADEWLALSIENRALASYKQTLTKLDVENYSQEIATERNIREIEKSLNNVIHTGWVYFDEFMKNFSACISENSKISLKKTGKNWSYSLPEYSEEEKSLIEKTILEWLFEAGLVSIGTHENQNCFCVTSFGQSIFL